MYVRTNNPEAAAAVLLFTIAVTIIFKLRGKSDEEREEFFENCKKGLVILFFIGCLAIIYSVYGK